MKFKRVFDFFLSLFGILFFSWIIFILWLIAMIETRSNGFFIQRRVGLKGKQFNMIKIKTMKDNQFLKSTITKNSDPRITKFGKWFRKYKLDELPSLYNVLIGEMSFVGPRPDVPGYADKLEGKDRIILNVRPGITGPATLKFAKEEYTLSLVKDPEEYNNEVLYPQKVKLNLEYINNWSFWMDLKIIFNTVFRKNY